MNDVKKLRNETIKGIFWSSASNFYSLGVQFVITMILSRLLSPDDFAAIGLLSIFTLFSNILIDSGFAQSLIREPELKAIDYSSVFYFNVVVATIIYVVLFFCSPFIASFFHIPELGVLACIVFIQLIFNALSIVPRVVLTREMRYDKLSFVGIVSITLSALTGIAAALLGMGVYAIVTQMLVMSFTNLVLIWFISKWHLTFEFSFMVIKRLLGFSMYLLSTSIIITLFNNLYTLIIGRNFSQTQLGFYTQAKKMEELPSQSITNIIVNVSYTAMSKVKDDIGLLRKAYQKVLGMNVFIIFPIMTFCLVSADSLIPFIFGEQWIPSVQYFKILCIYGMIFPLFSLNGNILKVLGLGRKYTVQELVRRVLMLLFLLPTIKMGIEAMLWGWVTSMFLSIIFSFILCGKPIQYTIISQFADLMPISIVSIVSMILPYVAHRMLICSNFLMLVIQFALFFSIFIVLSKFFGIQAYMDVKELALGHPIVNKMFKKK